MSDSDEPTLSAAEWSLAARQRALVYGWFCTLYAAELSAATLRGYLAGAAAPLLEGLDGLGLGAETARLQMSIDALRDTDLPQLELAADFAQLFLLDAKTGAPPYASLYENDGSHFCGAAETRMRTFLHESGLSVAPRFGEPTDHIAVHLSFMRHLLERHADTHDVAVAAADEARFLHEALFGWLPAFVQRCQRARPQCDFYPALAALLLAFLRQDALFLCDAAASAGRCGQPGTVRA